MGDFKPIETIYNGYRFRSRLEARWAVFFDAMGIDYEYECEGYEIDFADGSTLSYLPDFWLPEYSLHAEVKGCSCRGQIHQGDAEKMSWMIDFDGPCANGIILLGNIPDPKNTTNMSWAVWRWMGKGLEYGYIDDDYPRMEYFFAIDDQCAPHSFDENDDLNLTSTIFVDEINVVSRIGRTQQSKAAIALMKARQARFEHGETPTI